MPEKKQEPEAVKVVDRRRFTSEGELRPNAEPTGPSEPSTPTVPVQPTPGTAEPPPAKAKAQREKPRAPSPASATLGSTPPTTIDFETLVMSLSTSAMLQLGLVEDPKHGPVPPDLPSARHTIDLLAVIQDKTRGNLTPKESGLLEQVLYELRMAFLHLSGDPPPDSSTLDA